MLPAFPMFAPYATTFSPLQEKSPRALWFSSRAPLFGSRLLRLRFKTHVKGAAEGPSGGGAPGETFSRHKEETRKRDSTRADLSTRCYPYLLLAQFCLHSQPAEETTGMIHADGNLCSGWRRLSKAGFLNPVTANQLVEGGFKLYHLYNEPSPGQASHFFLGRSS